MSALMPKLATEVAFPNLKFDRPVAMAYPTTAATSCSSPSSGGDPVVPQRPADQRPEGRSSTSARRSTARTAAATTRKGCSAWRSTPSTRQNREFFVYYSAQGGPDRPALDRRAVIGPRKDDPRRADPASEERIWIGPPDPYGNHNGGGIVFGPDGYLYITLGDSGAADDPLTTGQNPKDWFGSILRIDVDHPADGKPYGIPKDNPRLRDAEVRRLGARGLLHRPAERLEVQLRPQDRHALGRRRRPEQVGDGPHHRERRQLRLEHQGGLPPVPPAPEGRPRLADLQARWPSIPTARTWRTPAAATTARASPAATSTAARRFPNWPASTSTATTTPGGSGASARRTARPSPTAS